MWCHVLFFGFPALGLGLFWLLPLPFAAGVYLPLAALSVGAGVATVRALRSPTSTGAEGMRGRPGRVEAVEGRIVLVRVGGELWKARSPEALVAEQPVVIVGVDGLTVTVRPLNKVPAESGPGRTGG